MAKQLQLLKYRHYPDYPPRKRMWEEQCALAKELYAGPIIYCRPGRYKRSDYILSRGIGLTIKQAKKLLKTPVRELPKL